VICGEVWLILGTYCRNLDKVIGRSFPVTQEWQTWSLISGPKRFLTQIFVLAVFNRSFEDSEAKMTCFQTLSVFASNTRPKHLRKRSTVEAPRKILGDRSRLAIIDIWPALDSSRTKGWAGNATCNKPN